MVTNNISSDLLTHAYDIYRPVLLANNTIQGGVKPYHMLSGRMAGLFFMLELYRQCKDPEVWNNIQAEIAWLEDYNRCFPGNNYTLFNGRMSMGYFFLELYRVTDDVSWLEKSTATAIGYFEGTAYQYDIIDNCSLYEGLGGIILFTSQLYLQTHDERILRGMEKLLLKLIYKSQTGMHGIYWGGVTNNMATNIGFGKGGAGIAFVLSEVGKCFNNKALATLAQQALDYEAAYWRETGHTPFANTGCFSGPHPVAMALAQLSLDKERVVLTAPPETPGQEAALGLAYLEIFKATGDDAAYALAEKIAMQILAAGTEAYHPDDVTAVYYRAFTGYFLLKYRVAKEDAPGNIYIPYVSSAGKLIPLPVTSIFNVGHPEISHVFMQANYRKTYTLLRDLLPDVLTSYQQLHGVPDTAVFAAYLHTCLEERKGSLEANAVLFEFEKEQFILRVRRSLKHSGNNTLPDDRKTIVLEELMHLGTAQFLSLRLVHAREVRMCSWEPAVKMDMEFDVMAFADFFQHYGARTCICYVTRDDKLQETFPGIIRLIFDRFTVPVTIREARDQIVHFIFRQPPAAIQLLKHHYEVADDQQFLEKVHGLVIDGVRLYMMEEILEVIP
jgi:hypothetical protein